MISSANALPPAAPAPASPAGEEEHTRKLEQRVEELLWTAPLETLERALRQLGDRETRLAGVPPLEAASRFRQAVQAWARSAGGRNPAAALPLSGPLAHPPPQRRFERALFVFGLRRAGNHALAEWLKGHFAEGDVLYLNSAEIAHFRTEGDTLAVDGADYAGVRLSGGESVLLVGYENLDFLDFPLAHNARVAARADLLVVLRDYPNMAASIARSARDRPEHVYRHRLRDFPEQWAAYARHFERRTGGFVYLSFNEWFSSLEYRRDLSARLGLAFSDRGKGAVSAHGLGSSFDGMAMDGAAASMDVLNRWRRMEGDDLFDFLLLAGADNLELNARLFGNFPLGRGEVQARWAARHASTRGGAGE
ncbi:MAG TPA: hypothetical protein VFJ82_19840 [Longimicrobium sp.]|nr:hypothetical protein [Longimicrobium sp.]